MSYDPLDTMTLDLTAKRAMCGEMNTYAVWAASQGVKGIRMRDNYYGQQQHMLLVANEEAAIVERRLENGLRRYEATTLKEMQEQLLERIEDLLYRDLNLYSRAFTLGVTVARKVDPVYLLYRQYNTGPFCDTTYPNTPLDP